MGSTYRPNSMMAMLDARSEESGKGGYWNDVNDHLSPVRRHLINAYLQVEDDEAMPLLGEYFGVALSFMALGALIRASNATKRKQRRTEEERLDLQSCSRFQRMALESMLKESMERLRNLSQNAYQLEERVRDLVDENVAIDKDKVQLLRRLADAEMLVQELRALRKAEGRANERVMCIVASKEQESLKEKRNFQKEIEKLKETVSGMNREAKFQARRCRNLNCEHCKGFDRVERNVKSRMSLRELNFRESQASAKRDAPRVDRHHEVEEDRVLIKSIEHKKKQSEQPGHLKNQNKVEKHVEWHDSASSTIPSGGSAGGAGQSMTKELLAKQHQDMESELANILKRVGMLKQRSNSNNATPMREESAPVEQRKLAIEVKEVTELPRSRSILDQVEEQIEVQKESITPTKHSEDPILELADCLSDQEDYYSVEDEGVSVFVGFQKELELQDGIEGSKPEADSRGLIDDKAGEIQLESESCLETTGSRDLEIVVNAGNQLQVNEVADIAQFESSLSSFDLEGMRNKSNVQETQESSSLLDNVFPATEEDELKGLPESDEAETFPETNVVSAAMDDVPQVESLPDDADQHDGDVDSARSGEDYQEATIPEEADAVSEATMELLYCDDIPEEGGMTTPEDCRHEERAEERAVNQDVQAPTSVKIDMDLEQYHGSGESTESEQLVEFVDIGNGTDHSDAPNLPLVGVTNLILECFDPTSVSMDSSEHEDEDHAENGLDIQENLNSTNSSCAEGELLDNQDIPVFERDNLDDLSGELPEPEEKRVCGSKFFDSNAGCTDGTSRTVEEESRLGGANLKYNNIVRAEEEDKEKDMLVEECVGLVTDEKSTSEEVSETCSFQELEGVNPILV